MPQSQPFTRTTILSELKRYLGAEAPFDELLRRAGIGLPDPAMPMLPVSLNAIMSLFDHAAMNVHTLDTGETGDPAFGINFARTLTPGGSGLLGQIIIFSAIVRDALKNVARLMPVYMSPFNVTYSENEGVGRLAWSFPSTATAPRVHYNMFLAASVVMRIRDASPGWVPLATELDHMLPKCADARARERLDRLMREMLGQRIRYNAASNSLSVDANTLACRMPRANATQLHFMSELADHWIEEQQRSPEGIVADVRQAISDVLKTGDITLERIAKHMRISSGALQWRLERAGTTFENELNEERQGRAEMLLRDTDRPLTEIAHELGFSDASAFSRAAKRWLRMTPSAWRRAQRRIRP